MPRMLHHAIVLLDSEWIIQQAKGRTMVGTGLVPKNYTIQRIAPVRGWLLGTQQTPVRTGHGSGQIF